jgi:hypothetical protein
MAKRAACETTRSKALRVVYEHLDLRNRLSEYKELHRRLQYFDAALNARDVRDAIEMYRLMEPKGSLALAASRLPKPRTEFDYLRCLHNVLGAPRPRRSNAEALRTRALVFSAHVPAGSAATTSTRRDKRRPVLL